jgi:hypothetical protein
MTLPKFITYKELMLVYGFGMYAAQNKLAVIRNVLGKKRYQNILIQEFCQAENVEINLFLGELKKEMEKIYQKTQVPNNIMQ